MFCKKCGRELRGTELICPACGTPVSEKKAVSEEIGNLFGTVKNDKMEARVEDIVWDVDVFPDIDSKKTEDVNFDWGTDRQEFPQIFGFEDAEKKDGYEVPEIKGLEDISTESAPDADPEKETKVPAEPKPPVMSAPEGEAAEKINKFYTFSQKNEDFQKMLEDELSKLEGGNSISYEQQEADRIVEEQFVPGKPVIRDELDELFAREGLSTDVPEQKYSPQLSENSEFEKRMRQMERQDRDAAVIAQKLAETEEKENAGTDPAAEKIQDRPKEKDELRFKFDTLPEIAPITAIGTDADEVKDEEPVPAKEKAVQEERPSRFEKRDTGRFDFSQLEALNAEIAKANAEVEAEPDIKIEPAPAPLSEPAVQEIAPQQEPVTVPQPAAAEPVTEPEAVLETEYKEPADHIREMHEARATFFGQMNSGSGEGNDFDWGAATVTLDKQSIKEALAETTESSETIPQPEQAQMYDEIAAGTPQTEESSEEQAMAYIEKEIADTAQKTGGKKKKKKGSIVLKIIIIILAVILLAEIVIIAIKYFADTSNAAKLIDANAVKLIDMINGTK